MSILNALGPMPFDITTLIPIGRLVKCMLKFVSRNNNNDYDDNGDDVDAKDEEAGNAAYFSN